MFEKAKQLLRSSLFAYFCFVKIVSCRSFYYLWTDSVTTFQWMHSFDLYFLCSLSWLFRVFWFYNDVEFCVVTNFLKNGTNISVRPFCRMILFIWNWQIWNLLEILGHCNSLHRFNLHFTYFLCFPSFFWGRLEPSHSLVGGHKKILRRSVFKNGVFGEAKSTNKYSLLNGSPDPQTSK